MKISIVIPVYNSSRSLKKLVGQIRLALVGMEYEIIFVDDFSSDGSFDVLRKIAMSFENILAVRLSRNFGQQNALLCGIRHSGGDYIVTMDDDLQHNPEYIREMLSKIQEGFECVYAVPKVQKQSLYRRLGSKLTGLFFQSAFSLPRGIKVSSFRMMTRRAAMEVAKCQESFVYISACMLRSTRHISCIQAVHRSREHGSSNYSLTKLAALFSKLAVYYCPAFRLLKNLMPVKEQYSIAEVCGFGNNSFYAEKSSAKRAVQTI